MVHDVNVAPSVKIPAWCPRIAAETDEEHTSSLATVLDFCLTRRWAAAPNFRAADLACYLGSGDESSVEIKAALELASQKPMPVITPNSRHMAVEGNSGCAGAPHRGRHLRPSLHPGQTQERRLFRCQQAGLIRNLRILRILSAGPPDGISRFVHPPSPNPLARGTERAETLRILRRMRSGRTEYVRHLVE
jgi:hypothetical protein